MITSFHKRSLTTGRTRRISGVTFDHDLKTFTKKALRLIIADMETGVGFIYQGYEYDLY